jgi:hypothetical protein
MRGLMMDYRLTLPAIMRRAELLARREKSSVGAEPRAR